MGKQYYVSYEMADGVTQHQTEPTTLEQAKKDFDVAFHELTSSGREFNWIQVMVEGY